jgi:hypothetical protein
MSVVATLFLRSISGISQQQQSQELLAELEGIPALVPIACSVFIKIHSPSCSLTWMSKSFEQVSATVIVPRSVTGGFIFIGGSLRDAHF